MLYLISHIVADSFSFDFSMEMMANLSVYCANSNRKRIPKLYQFAKAV